MKQHEQLRKYNRWRRGDKRLKMPDPKELGELIDRVADRLEVLEREHKEIYSQLQELIAKSENLLYTIERDRDVSEKRWWLDERAQLAEVLESARKC